jgi:hypothetical protein
MSMKDIIDMSRHRLIYFVRSIAIIELVLQNQLFKTNFYALYAWQSDWKQNVLLREQKRPVDAIKFTLNNDKKSKSQSKWCLNQLGSSSMEAA